MDKSVFFVKLLYKNFNFKRGILYKVFIILCTVMFSINTICYFFKENPSIMLSIGLAIFYKYIVMPIIMFVIDYMTNSDRIKTISQMIPEYYSPIKIEYELEKGKLDYDKKS